MKFHFGKNRYSKSSAGEMGIVRRIFLSLFFFIFFVMGAGFTALMVKSAFNAISAHSWPRTEARIISTQIVNEDSKDEAYVLNIEYEYELAGMRYKGSNFYRNSSISFL